MTKWQNKQQTKKSKRLNQWKDTSEVINWFNKIEEKSKHTFMVFDIKDFYPSISKYLLQKALDNCQLSRHYTKFIR